MTSLHSKVLQFVLTSGLILGLTGVAHGSPTPGSASRATAITKQKPKTWGAAEMGFQGTIVAEGVTFLGPVLTLQAGHYRPLVAVFQFGVGAVLYKDAIPDQIYAPTDPEADPTEKNAMFYVGLGLRIRIFQFLASLRNSPVDLYVGPLAMVFGNHDLVTFGAGGELGVGLHFGRIRVSLSVHGGYQSVLHQYAKVDEYEFEASFLIGGQLSAGFQF